MEFRENFMEMRGHFKDCLEMSWRICLKLFSSCVAENVGTPFMTMCASKCLKIFRNVMKMCGNARKWLEFCGNVMLMFRFVFRWIFYTLISSYQPFVGLCNKGHICWPCIVLLLIKQLILMFYAPRTKNSFNSYRKQNIYTKLVNFISRSHQILLNF